ncbi:hypothetical protein [Haemophilus haemolyticus]|uniref:hypothetical protein n=1 Tax=Haemophilus haemolyticus TaxID=726 RepID=UPI000E57DE87|nr:hypothetical protein [Haemophilus haemolyticus]
MKQQFITSLKNGQVPFLENEKAFSALADDLFEPYNEIMVSLEQHQHRWSEDYFNQKAMDLDFNFSKELVQHLIKVKKHLQEQGILKPLVQASNQPATFEQPKEVETVTPIYSVAHKSQAVKKEENIAKPDLLNFKPNEKLTNFLSEGNLSKIRTYLMSMLNNRRMDLEEVFKSIWYVHQYKPSVFEQAEESAFIQDIDKNEENWNVDYFNQQQVYLNKNFSLARLLHLANVRETLMKKGDRNFQQIIVEKAQEQVRVEPRQQTSTTSSSSSSRSYTTRQEPPKQEQPRYQQPRQDVPKYNEPENDNGFIKTVAMIGGAVLVLAVALFAIFK